MRQRWDRADRARVVCGNRIRVVTSLNPDLIAALRATARRLEGGAVYRWTHMGSCNCGHLAQTLTRLPREEIHRRLLERAGDWGEQAREYCPASGFPMDHVLAVIFDAGLTRDDVYHLERLSDPDVLRHLPVGERHLDHRRRRDVVRYLRTWAEMLDHHRLESPGSIRRAALAGL